MSIVVKCSCGKKLRAKDSTAEKTVRCPACKNQIKIPSSNVADHANEFHIETGDSHVVGQPVPQLPIQNHFAHLEAIARNEKIDNLPVDDSKEDDSGRPKKPTSSSPNHCWKCGKNVPCGVYAPESSWCNEYCSDAYLLQTGLELGEIRVRRASGTGGAFHQYKYVSKTPSYICKKCILWTPLSFMGLYLLVFAGSALLAYFSWFRADRPWPHDWWWYVGIVVVGFYGIKAALKFAKQAFCYVAALMGLRSVSASSMVSRDEFSLWNQWV